MRSARFRRLLVLGFAWWLRLVLGVLLLLALLLVPATSNELVLASFSFSRSISQTVPA
jgi:hypothetical protein